MATSYQCFLLFESSLCLFKLLLSLLVVGAEVCSIPPLTGLEIPGQSHLVPSFPKALLPAEREPTAFVMDSVQHSN